MPSAFALWSRAVGILTILLLAVGLAMDAVAVSAARGFAASSLRPRDALKVALFFGGFQTAMPLAGSLVGRQAGKLFEDWDHWIAFVLLAGLGVKMILEARKEREANTPRESDPRVLFGWRVMSLLALATSIDAFAAGITLPLLGAPVPVSLATIGVTTAVLSALGLAAGARLGAAFGPKLDIAGGVVLIGLAVKILVEHLSRG